MCPTCFCHVLSISKIYFLISFKISSLNYVQKYTALHSSICILNFLFGFLVIDSCSFLILKFCCLSQNTQFVKYFTIFYNLCLKKCIILPFASMVITSNLLHLFLLCSIFLLLFSCLLLIEKGLKSPILCIVLFSFFQFHQVLL